MPLNKIDHYSVRTTDVEATRTFYENVLGLRAGARPEFPFPGAWLYHDNQAVVHVIGIDPSDSSGLLDYLGERGSAESGSGNFDHIAFTASDFEGMKSHFQACKAEFRERGVPALSLNQLFLTDPNGITIELNFKA